MSAHLSPERSFVITAGDTKTLFNPKVTPEELNRWAKVKWGEEEPDDLTWSLPVQLGVVTEELNLRFLEHKHNKPITDRQRWVRHATYPFGATLDGRMADTLIEAKWANPYGDLNEAVSLYTLQVTMGMLCTGLDQAILSIIRGATLQEFDIRFDPDLSKRMIERCVKAYDCLISMTLPGGVITEPPPCPPELWKTINLATETPLPNWAPAMIDNFRLWSTTRDAARQHEDSKKSIKELMPSDAGRIIYGDLTASRSKNGAVTVREKEIAF